MHLALSNHSSQNQTLMVSLAPLETPLHILVFVTFEASTRRRNIQYYDKNCTYKASGILECSALCAEQNSLVLFLYCRKHARINQIAIITAFVVGDHPRNVDLLWTRKQKPFTNRANLCRPPFHFAPNQLASLAFFTRWWMVTMSRQKCSLKQNIYIKAKSSAVFSGSFPDTLFKSTLVNLTELLFRLLYLSLLCQRFRLSHWYVLFCNKVDEQIWVHKPQTSRMEVMRMRWLQNVPRNAHDYGTLVLYRPRVIEPS